MWWWWWCALAQQQQQQQPRWRRRPVASALAASRLTQRRTGAPSLPTNNRVSGPVAQVVKLFVDSYNKNAMEAIPLEVS